MLKMSFGVPIVVMSGKLLDSKIFDKKGFYLSLCVVVCQMVASMGRIHYHREYLYHIDLKDAQFVYIE